MAITEIIPDHDWGPWLFWSPRNLVPMKFGPREIWALHENQYSKVASSRLSQLVAHSRIFRLFMKGKIDACVLWPLAKWNQKGLLGGLQSHTYSGFLFNHNLRNKYVVSTLVETKEEKVCKVSIRLGLFLYVTYAVMEETLSAL